MGKIDQSNKEGIKFKHNEVYREVKSVAEIYVDTIAEDILPLQYGKIMTALDYAMKSLNNPNIVIPDNLDQNTKDQIIELKNQSYRLSRNPANIKLALNEYLQEQLVYYTEKDSQIRQIANAEDSLKKEEIIDSFINDKTDDKKQELINSITNSYDMNNRLVGYIENQANEEQKEAWINRDSHIQMNVKKSLNKWKSEEKNNYLKAEKIFTHPDQAAEIIKQHREEASTILDKSKETLSKDQYALRAGKKTESIEDYLLVQEGILTKEEAELFNYEELNTYKVYYGPKEAIIKDIFRCAKKYYPTSKKQGLEALASVNYDKIPDLFKLLFVIEKRWISFEEFAEYSREKVEILSSNSQLLEVLKVPNIIDIQTAISNQDIKTTIDIINSIPPESGSKVFEWAVAKGHLNILEFILEKAGNHISADDKGLALKEAAKSGHYNIVKFFLEKEDGILVQHKSEAFILAIGNSDDDIAKFILEKIGNAIPAEYRGVALICNAQSSNYELVKAILEKGDDISELHQGLALECGAQSGNYESVKLILEKGRVISPEYIGKSIQNAHHGEHFDLAKLIFEKVENAAKVKLLKWGIENSSSEVVKFILENAGDDITAEYLSEAFMFAVAGGYYEIAKFIMEKAGDKILEEHKLMPLQKAATDGNYDVIQFILKEGNSISTERKEEAFEIAAARENYVIAKFILENVREISDKCAGRVLVCIANQHQYELVKSLFEKVNAIPAEYKAWALKYAVVSGDCEVVKYILNNDAQIDPCESYLLAMGHMGNEQIHSQDKAEALKIAEEKQNQNMINILQKYQDHNLVTGVIATIGNWSARIIGERANSHITNIDIPR